MADSFNSLRFNPVIGGNNQNDNIGYLGSAGTHFRKCFVSRRINERNFLAIVQRNLISADVLRNTACFTRSNIRFTQCIQQGRFTVVNVSHNSYYRRTRQQIGLGISRTGQAFLNIAFGHAFKFMSHFFNDNLRRIGINRLVNRRHNAQGHQLFDNIRAFFRHTVCQILHSDNFRDYDFFDYFFLRSLRLALRFRRLFLKTTARCPITVIIVVIIIKHIRVNADFRIAFRRFKTAFLNFFAFLFKCLFAAYRFSAFCRRRLFAFFGVVVIILVILIIIIFFMLGIIGFVITFGKING